MDEIEQLKAQVAELTKVVQQLFVAQSNINLEHKRSLEELMQASSEHRSGIIYLDRLVKEK